MEGIWVKICWEACEYHQNFLKLGLMFHCFDYSDRQALINLYEILELGKRSLGIVFLWWKWDCLSSAWANRKYSFRNQVLEHWKIWRKLLLLLRIHRVHTVEISVKGCKFSNWTKSELEFLLSFLFHFGFRDWFLFFRHSSSKETLQ